MKSLCPYSKIFGEPGKGVHSYRIANLAIVDVIFTILAAWIIASMLRWNFWYTLGGLFLLGILLHRAFCVRTTLDKLLFPGP